MASPPSRLVLPTKPIEAGDADDISITSTDPGDNEDEEKEWIVDDLYAERPHPDISGEKQYLIKWDGFPLDQCTWEPVENLGPGLLSQWEETKKEVEAGTRQPFNIAIYHEALKEKERRHIKRNEKRKRLGQPLTYPLPESPVQERSSTGGDSDFHEEPPEMNDIPTRPPSLPKLQTITKPKASSTAIPEKPRVEANGARIVPKPKKKPKQTSPTLPPPTVPTAPTGPKQQGVKKRKVSRDGPASATATGYQGTARKSSGSRDLKTSKTPINKAPNQKTSPTTARASGLPPRTSSLANKFSGKRLMATRTRPQPQPTQVAPAKRTSNVFVGGKERKKRVSLADRMDDPSQAPKAFSTLRVMNLAKKRGIERLDTAAPDLSSIPASFLLTNDHQNRPKADNMKANIPFTTPASPAIVQSPMAMSPTDTNPIMPVPKAKKSVRFTGASEIPPQDEPIIDVVEDVVDHPARGLGGGDDFPVSPGSAPGSVRTPSAAQTAARRVSLVNYQERGQTQVVAKAVMFGKAGPESVKVLFAGITRQSQPWLSAFIAQEILDFSTICASYNFISHQAGLVGEILSAGVIEFHAQEILPILTNVAEHLRRDSYGSHLVTENFSILVYPTKCNGWNELGVNIDDHSSKSPLRYIIYQSVVDTRLYPPASVPRAPARLSHTEQGSHCRVLVQDVFGLDHSEFLPQEPKLKDKQVFMLLFPEREMQVCNMVKLWLRSRQPKCRIFSNELQDSWMKFHEAVVAGAAGTIILHEDVTVSIRKIPRIHQMIEYKRCYTFWDLSTGQYDPSRFPSDRDEVLEPGTLQLTRIFPQGRAFLITPSFVLSDPTRLCQFLEYYKRYCANPHYLLMACADFPDYLKAVTLEKEKEREAMCSAHKSNPKLEDMLVESGLSRSDLEARFRAWEILKEIMGQFGDEEASEEIRKVQWITDFIDPNDEQSLVNWFCWWSTVKCDQYRKFTVLGSSNKKIRAAYRHIEIPAYTAETVCDPDVALAREDELRQSRREAEERMESGQDVFATPVSTTTSSAPNTPVSRPIRATDLRNRNISLYNGLGGNWARLHANPVSWLNVSMADHFGDVRCEFDTFNNWFFSNPKTYGVNTWYGLFYTIDKEWNPNTPPDMYERHPWIAVFRPVNPHNPRNYAEMELFIWDVSAGDREYSLGRPSLLDMQQHLIDFVRQKTPQRDSRYRLDRVYISSKTNFVIEPTDSVLDITYLRLQEMIGDGKTCLPPFENLLRSRGWVNVPSSEWQTDFTAESSGLPPVPQFDRTIHRHPDDENKLQRSIWHAPRPNVMGEKSKCVNHLHEAARSAREKDSSCQNMKYQYRSTLDWYHDMKAEGRDSSHVNVDSADKILSILKK
ncbi:hypothetical protein GGR54DRAFT_206520 [Hypoxylon sp. NC1633]|nr:hypothetical protein GGR54DRAFT_206520 [Hypoxylon sp. NC1633]